MFFEISEFERGEFLMFFEICEFERGEFLVRGAFFNINSPVVNFSEIVVNLL